MIAIIAEKPSTDQDIARVAGATEKKDGYIMGNGYIVAQALGHLVLLALPDAYGYTRTTAENLPMIPDPSRLVAWQVRTDRGMVTDIAAGRQLKVIGEVLAGYESIIAATDAGREGELIFRWIYSYLGCTEPFKRLWISSLTDEATRGGIASPKEGTGYDSLYAAADSRVKVDWLVGMNASRALAAAPGSVNNPIGRVQTPTLAMVCVRFKENRNFVSTLYWRLHMVLKGDNGHRQFIHTKEFRDRNMAEAAYKSIAPRSVVIITKIKRGKIFQQAPLLYDLTTLQKDCNIRYDLSVGKILTITQSLYEKKLASYPRTGSRYIPQDVMAHIPALLEKITAIPEFREYRRSLDLSVLNTRSVDAVKVTDYHTLIITGIVPEGPSEAEPTIYTLTVGKMLGAFSPPCERGLLLMECVCGGLDSHSCSTVVANPDWRAVLSRKEDREKDESERDKGTASFTGGEEVPATGYGLSQKKTLPKPPYTEITLLMVMENRGKEITDRQARKVAKDTGIGTPITCAVTITTLLKRDYIERSGRNTRPTEKGLYLYESVKDMAVIDAKLTGAWGKALGQTEGRTLDPKSFMLFIREYTGKVIGEILRLKFPEPSSCVLACPKCKTGNVVVKSKVAKCDRKGCGLLVFRHLLNKELMDQHLEQPFSSGSIRLIKGFEGKKGVPFDAAIIFDESFNLKLLFPRSKGGKGK